MPKKVNHGSHTTKKLNKKKWGRSAERHDADEQATAPGSQKSRVHSVRLDSAGGEVILDLYIKLCQASGNAIHGKVKRHHMVKNMVREDRIESKKASEGSAGASGEAAASPSSVPPKILPKVRLEVCAEKKDGTPNLGERKLFVLERSIPLEQHLKALRGKFRMKKAPKGLGVVSASGPIASWLDNLDTIADGALVCLSASGGSTSQQSKPLAPPPPPFAVKSAGAGSDEEGGIEGCEHDEGAGEDDSESDESSEGGEDGTPSAAEILGRLREAYSSRGSQVQQKMSSGSNDVDKTSDLLLEERISLESTDEYLRFVKQRKALPMYASRGRLLELIQENQVVILSGDTGCGKTTQVPQFILEKEIGSGRGALCNIICTQPRRISAIGVAERVAAERCTQLGKEVGYQIRLDNKTSYRTRLRFCTMGILLRRLLLEPNLDGISHIVIDEAHERQMEMDFALIILQDLLERRPDLRLVIMSATLQASLFSEYFGGAPVISVEGRTFPVTCHPLADVYRALKKRMPAPARGNGGSAGAPDSGGSKGGSAPTELRMSPPCGEPLDYNLVGDLLRHIVQVEGPAASGSILIFLPGFAEIDRIIRLIRGDPVLNRACKAMPLHSSLSSAEQRAIFRKYPGQRKVIASTNIAETSITIEDCTHVIDSGRVKEVRYDTVSRHSCLLEVWTSRASTKQRAGRSGRVQAGNCWQLFSMEMQESCMPHYTLPELLRMPLEELVLQALVMEVGDPSEFLGRAVQPPPPAMLGLAVQNLIELQAVKREEDEEDDDEQAKGSLTLLPLGFHLAHLPMDARIGKILIMGSIFGCLDPVLTIAATLASKHPFVRPYNDSGAADSARMAFAQHKSDHLASLEAYSAWQSASGRSYGEVKQWCRQHYLSLTGLETIQGLRRQFLDRLRDAGFAQVDGSGVLHAQHNAHASNPRLIACVLCSGLLPQVAYFVRQRPSHFVTRDDVEPVHMHPGSVNFSRFRAAAQTGSTPFVCYYTKAKTSRVYLMDSTVITPFSILLWGGNIRHLRRAASTSRAPETRVKRGCVVAEVDRWLKFSTEEAVAVLFKHLRREVSAILVNKMLAPGASVTNAVMGDTVVKLLQLEGAGV